MARIDIQSVNIDFPILDSTHRSFRRKLVSPFTGGIIKQIGKNKTPVVRALDSITLTINDGERVGLVGHNGAGKSTLLQTMAGVYWPVSGQISISGKISPLFNTFLGISQDDTGFENIINIGMFLGMTMDEIEKKMDSIIEACEIGDFLNLPVRTYSSGMNTRLAFAIATSIEPEILLLDEWIGAGDSRFAKKAEHRIKGLVDRSNILVLASHSEALLKKVCNKGVLLEHGKILMTGTIKDVFECYHRSLAK